MGLYWNGLKTNFNEIGNLKDRYNEPDFDWLEVIEHPSSEKVGFSIKVNRLIHYTEPIENGTKFFTPKEKEFYNTFFFHTIWTTFDEQDALFIDLKKYTNSFSNDDLGWKELDSDIYWKAFSQKTLNQIVLDFEKLDFNLLRNKYVRRYKSFLAKMHF